MMNICTIMGRLTKDPTLRQTGNGISVCSFSIACDREYSSGEEKKVDFIDCVAWRKTGEFVNKFFVKGKPILVVGRLQMRDWTDNNGNKRRNYEVIVDEAHFCGGDKVNKAAAPEVPQVAPGEFVELPGGDGELPFDMNGFGDIADLPV